MVDFVLKQINERNKEPEYDSFEFMEKVTNYANFLIQPLTLGMFVPCDLDGDILNEPLKRDYNNVNINNSYYKEYQEAKKRVLFESWAIMQRIGDSIVVFNENSDIIEFINDKIWVFDEYKASNISELGFYSEKENIPFLLTPTAQKQLTS